jgi:DNA ligase-1
MKLPTLYKRTSTGAIEQWTVWVEPTPGPLDINGDPHDSHDIVTEYGHVDGKLQQARETVHQGKNLGKKNATTPKEQAEAQATSEWGMKISRKGYVDSIEKAQAGLNDGAGGIRPMLAKPFEDVEKKWKYPCFTQPKLDGIRCIAVVGDDGDVTLWTREQKPILAVPRIAIFVKYLGLPAGTVLDGELYNHDLKDDFEKIVSCVRKQYVAPLEEQKLIQYHVYDMPRIPGFEALGFGDPLGPHGQVHRP